MAQTKRTVLVVGGAGYVGSANVSKLLSLGHDVAILDDLSTGHPELILTEFFYKGRAGDRALVAQILNSKPFGRPFDCVMHFAAKAIVSESVAHPEMYYENNVEQTQILLEEMNKAGVDAFVFSSTCAIFGEVGDRTIDENLPKNPVNPYGDSKLKAEQHLQKLALEGKTRSIALRYFNAAGADPSIAVGEWHQPETHLIPLIFRAIYNQQPVSVFGSDYPTRDGTCVRDYIHVSDLADAHVAAMERLLAAKKSGEAPRFEAFNLGSENGTSVLEMIHAAAKVTQKKIDTTLMARRPGDPPQLVAQSQLARDTLGFKPQHGIESILQTAWKWEQRNRSRSKAVFLDRDGTLNIDPGYISSPEKLELLPGAPQALLRLKKLGYQLILLSNQSGVSRGIIAPEDLPKIHEHLNQLIEKEVGVRIDGIYVCIHHPDANCACRKPKGSLIWKAAVEHGLALDQSIMIGDRISDVRAGRNGFIGKSVLVRTGHGQKESLQANAEDCDFIADTISQAVDWIEHLKA